MTKIKFPFGPADNVALDNPADAYDQAIDNSMTIIKITSLAGARTINLIPDAELDAGAEVIVDVVQGATGRNVTLGTNVVAPALTGVADDRDSIALVYDGTEFIAKNAWVKIVDAA